MLLFIKELIQRLDNEEKKWRKNTALIWDGAGYHRSKEMYKMLEEQ